MSVFTYVSVILSVGAIFTAMMVLLAAEPKISSKITGAALVIAAAGGLLFYGYGYAYTEGNLPVAIIRGVLALCSMFVGGTDFELFSNTPLAENPLFHVFFWFIHLAALYATASATIAAIGAEALKKLRLWMVHRRNLCIIYGVTPDSVEFGRALISQTRDTVVFVDPQPDPTCIEAVSQSGCILRTDESALDADIAFSKSIGLRSGNRRIALYALSYDGISNLHYADRLQNTLRLRGIAPEKSSLIILGAEDSAASRLQVTDSRYGYGFVTVFQEADLVSRLLIQKYPPCNTLNFDENGAATENFEALIVGFGHLGQSVLRSLVMNGQFVGSTFRCTVFDPQCNALSGLLMSTCRTMMSHYNISLQPYDARSDQMFSFLSANADTLKYIVVSTNDVRLNRSIAADILRFLHRTNHHIPVYQCSCQGIVCSCDASGLPDTETIYSPGLLRYDRIDRLAMGINQTYQQSTAKTPLQNWMACDYFSRMSSRASADFFPAVLRAAGTTPKAVLTEPWHPEGQLLENLGKMEHLRWNAFHFCMGYNPMTEEEYTQRCAWYLEDIRNGRPPRRIGKNTAAQTHACLISWEELDALSERENAVTGGNVDYKLMDIRNVLAIADILRASSSC